MRPISLLQLYRLAARASAPLVRRHLERRVTQGKEDALRLPERLGEPGRERPPGPLIWLHAASVGEAVSVLALVRRLLAGHPHLTVLLTSGTVTSARLLGAALPDRALHQYAPVDLPQAATRFLDHWRPDLVLWVESELWPVLLHAIHERHLPLILVNGRMSERSFRGWSRAPRAIAGLLQAFVLCLAQSEADAERLSRLGARTVRCPGNIKFSASPLEADQAELARLRTAIAARPCWTAVSTHAGEETLVAEAHRRLAAGHPGLLTILAPRHPERGRELAEALHGQGLAVARRAAGEGIAPDTGIYLADTIGELGLWLRLARIALVGGSLVPHGGHNPLEPAKLGCAVAFGPHMQNFAEIAGAMRNARAALQVDDMEHLAATVARLLGDPREVERLGVRAQDFAASRAQALERVMAELRPWLDRLA